MHPDWTKEQFEDIGLKKEVNDLAGEIVYSSQCVKYLFRGTETPTAVTVYALCDVDTPRNINIGDSFDKVLSLFPQEKNWENSKFGEFYGQSYETDQHEPTGAVGSFNGERMITLTTENVYPFIQIYFKDDRVESYRIFLIDAH
mgnify:FL=1